MKPRQPAHPSKVPIPVGCVERGKGGRRASSISSVSGLRARACARGGGCVRGLLRAARSRLRLGCRAGDLHARGDRGRPRLDLALRAAASGRSTCRATTRAGSHAAPRRPTARERARHRRAVPQARHRQSDALVQGPRRRGRLREGARARRDDARMLVDRQPRERGRRARSGGGDRGRGSLPGRPRAREALRRPRSTARRSTPSTGATTTAPA